MSAPARQSARSVALRVIQRASEADAYANLLLPHEIERAGLSAADAGLATELTYGTLRGRGTYDAVIAVASGRALDRIDPPVLDALRIGVHQLFETRIPPHAAVGETVALVPRRATGFVNAVLRAIASESRETWLQRAEDAARSDDERLAVRTSHPVWVIRAFRRALAAEGRAGELSDLLAADNAAPTVTMAALPGLAGIPDAAEPTPYSPLGFRLGGGAPDTLIADAGGRIRVQDEGSQLAALALSRALPVRPEERWLDLCAGPGGKSAVLGAEAVRGGARFEANEVSPHRADLVRRSVAAVPADIPVSVEDGRHRATPDTYDRILVDAPCTGLGALRRRPEARWRKHPADVTELAALQRELLSAAIRGLRPGGVVAYVTCSPHLAETADIVRGAYDEFGDAVRELDAKAVLNSVSRAPLDFGLDDADGNGARGGGRAQLWPHRHGTDAMSISLLQRH